MMEFIFCMHINIEVSASFWWKWPDMIRVPKKWKLSVFLQYISTTAFVFYYDEKHSSILWGCSRVRCYLLKLRNTFIQIFHIIFLKYIHTKIQFGVECSFQWFMYYSNRKTSTSFRRCFLRNILRINKKDAILCWQKHKVI